jgi:hypothetical protein
VLQTAKNKGKKMELFSGQFRNGSLDERVCPGFVKTEIVVYAFGSLAKMIYQQLAVFGSPDPYFLLQKC